MDDHTRLALEADIALWDENAHATRSENYNTGVVHSTLCREFNTQVGSKVDADTCAGCPVREATGAPRCVNTNYQRARQAGTRWLNFETYQKNVVKAHKAMIEAQREARFMAEFLRKLHPDNTPEAPPAGVVDSMERACAVAVGEGIVGVLVNFDKLSPLHRGLLTEVRERYKDQVTMRRYHDRVGFQSGGQLILLHTPKDWATARFDAVFIHSMPQMVMPYEVRELYGRINK